jgi:hypothetical protein
LSQGLLISHCTVEANVLKQLVYPAELEIALRDKIRGTPLYHRLTDLIVTGSGDERGGWDVQIEGSFSPEDRQRLDELVTRSRDRFQLNPVPDPCFPRLVIKPDDTGQVFLGVRR